MNRNRTIGIVLLFSAVSLLLGFAHYLREREQTVVVTVINRSSATIDSVTMNVYGGIPSHPVLKNLAPGQRGRLEFATRGFSSYSLQVQLSEKSGYSVEERLAYGGLRATETIGPFGSTWNYDWISPAYDESFQLDHPFLTFPVRIALSIKL